MYSTPAVTVTSGTTITPTPVIISTIACTTCPGAAISVTTPVVYVVTPGVPTTTAAAAVATTPAAAATKPAFTGAAAANNVNKGAALALGALGLAMLA